MKSDGSSSTDINKIPKQDGAISSVLSHFVISDLISTRNHSTDFDGSRADHITVRVRLMALILAILTPMWIVVDIFTLSADLERSIIILRILVAVSFAALALWVFQRHSLTFARLRLGLLLLVGSVFYVSARIILNGSVAEESLVSGYTFIPFLFLAMLTLFPLTIIEGILFCMVAMVTLVGSELYQGTLLTHAALTDSWLLALIAVFAVGAQVSQLQMLLQLHRQATRDVLTGLFNRRVLMERLGQEILRSQRYGSSLSIVLLDLDRFKRINDTFGHLTGDAVLKLLATQFMSELRTVDVCGRYGGEEFLAVLPETGLEGAAQVAERIRLSTEALLAHGPDGQEVTFTVSAGVAELVPPEDGDALFKKADECLYEAKESGRNRVVLAQAVKT